MFRFISVESPRLLLAGVMISCSSMATADVTYGPVRLETCLETALEKRAGRVIKLEMKRQRGELVYEFDIRDHNGQDWDLECSAETGRVLEIEREVATPNHPDFAARQRISEHQARLRALAAYPGEIVAVEYEIEESGRAVFEFDIYQRDGTTMKVEIDAGQTEAASGVHEFSEKLWQIGYE